MNKFLAAIIIFLASVNTSWAACGSWSGNTVTAGACTTTEINACLSEVTTSNVGEVTINLPSCNINDTGTLVVNMNDAKYTNVTKLSVIGAGTIPTGSTRGSAGSSVINRGTTTNSFLNLTGSSAKKFRFSNVRITGTSSSGSNGIFVITGTSRPAAGGGWRIDHCDLGTDAAPINTRVLYVKAARTYGVMDHNLGYTTYQMAYIGEPLGGNPSWNRAISVGTNEAVYFEDNTFYQKATSKNWFFADGVDGARIVVRYNNMYGYHIGAHDASSNGRGVFQYEAYNNLIDFYLTKVSGGSYSPHFYLRGGTNIMYNNDLRNTGNGGSWETGILLMNYRSRASLTGMTSPWTDACNSTQVRICAGPLTSTKWEGWSANNICDADSDCGGTSGSCQNIDGNSTGNGWPCRDQIGVTSDGTISGQFTQYPSLFWNNNYCAGAIGCTGTYYAPVVRVDGATTTHIQNNRDYCHHETTMPASCGGIATTYTAYTYPHPLVGGVTDTTNPYDLTSLSPTGQQACATNPSNVAISLSATDNVAVTGVRCCVENGTTCTSATAYASRDVVLTNTSGTTWGATVSSACDTDVQYNCMSTDAAGNFSNNGVISYQMADNSDTTAPTMSTQAIGADGRTVTFTFSEAVTIGAGGSAGFTLTNGDSEAISITYVSGAGSTSLVYQSSVCIPSTDTFTAGLVYTQPTNGIEDMAGNDLTSFTGAGAKTVTNGSTQSCDLATSLFTHPESAPSGTANYSGNAVNLGVKFQTSVAASMTHCWFYKIATDTGTHVCTVYRVSDGSTVGTVDFADESESGWQDQAFASALNIAANEDYIVTVSHPTGNWTGTADYFASTYTNGNLTATTAGTDYAGRYVYGASMAYPTNDSPRNYWVDFTLSYADPVTGPWQCTVSRTGDGCMVTGSQVVDNAGTCSATVTLRNGWKATWGGTCPAGSEVAGVYTSGSITADCTLIAACTEQGILP